MISPSVRDNFVRDEANFMVQFVSGEQQHATSNSFTHAEADEVGTRVEATGSYERCPVTVSVAVLKSFGTKLKEFSE